MILKVVIIMIEALIKKTIESIKKENNEENKRKYNIRNAKIV